MSKKIINDIMIKKRSIREIPLPSEKKRKSKEELPDLAEDHSSREIRSGKYPSFSQKRSMNPRFTIWLIAIFCLIALFFGISTIFSSATVIITPRVESILFNNDTYVAKSKSIETNELSFEVLTLKQTIGETINATSEKEVEQKASGKIIIYNNYSTTAQRLINNTRFESSDNRVYRINNSVVVPGIKKVDGKVNPGSVEVTVYADQPGEGYNMMVADLTGDFKIPGFKGDPRYNDFYARIKEDIKGGFIGTQKVVDPEIRAKAEESVKLKLKEELIKELYAVKPESYIVFDNSYTINFLNQDDTNIDDNKVMINVQGILNCAIFNNQKLSNYLATKKIESFDGLPVEMIITDKLISILNINSGSDLAESNDIEINFDGEAQIKWVYNVNDLKKDLAGKKGSAIGDIVVKYHTSLNAIDVIFKPVWTRYLPDNQDKIYIKEKSL